MFSPKKMAEPIAAAVFFESEHSTGVTGSSGHYDALHFENPTSSPITRGLELGTQGEHKISRGFSPVTTWSAHWLAHPEFADAISRYLDEEARHVDCYMDTVDSRSPYKSRE